MQSPVNDEIQQFIDQMGLREFAQQGYHKYSIDAVRRHAISVYQQGNKSNFAQVASLTWIKNPKKGHDAKILIEHFDEFRRRGIDTTAVTGRNTISFAHPIRYDLPDNKLIAIG